MQYLSRYKYQGYPSLSCYPKTQDIAAQYCSIIFNTNDLPSKYSSRSQITFKMHSLKATIALACGLLMAVFTEAKINARGENPCDHKVTLSYGQT
jgi:hypothetical protein